MIVPRHRHVSAGRVSRGYALYDEAYGPPPPPCRKPVAGEWDDPTWMSVEPDDEWMFSEHVRAVRLERYGTHHRSGPMSLPSGDAISDILQALTDKPATAREIVDATGRPWTNTQELLLLLVLTGAAHRSDRAPYQYRRSCDPTEIEWDIDTAAHEWEVARQQRRATAEAERNAKAERKAARKQAQDARRRRDEEAAVQQRNDARVLTTIATVGHARLSDLVPLQTESRRRVLARLLAQGRIRKDHGPSGSVYYRLPPTPSLAQRRAEGEGVRLAAHAKPQQGETETAVIDAVRHGFTSPGDIIDIIGPAHARHFTKAVTHLEATGQLVRTKHAGRYTYTLPH